MALYKKTLLVIALTLIGLFAILYVSFQMILLKSFDQLEQQETVEHVQRTATAFNSRIKALNTVAIAYANWDDSYNFITDPNQDYIDQNLVPNFYADTDLNVTIFLNNNGEPVFERGFDLDAEQEIPVPQSLKNLLTPGSPLLDHPDISSEISGIVSLPEGLMVVISLPILNNEAMGPINGTMIWGQFIDDHQIRYLEETTHLDVVLEAVNSAPLPADFTTAVIALMPETRFFAQPLSEQIMAGYCLIDDIYGEPVALLRVEIPRNIYAQGQASITYFLGSLLLAGVVFAGVVLLLLERTVLARLARLSAAVTRIRATDDLTISVKAEGNDEIANLARGMNSMLAAVAQSRARLQEAHDQLERRVEDRTADLTEANALLRQEIAERQQAQALLAQARDQALEALRLKTQILANISHDARTPLTAITLQSEMLQMERYGKTTERQQIAFQSILVSTRQLLNFITNLLGEAQLNSGKTQLRRVEFSPRHLIDEVTTLLMPLAERKKITIKAETDDDIAEMLYGDPDRLKQIVMNLIDNAIKFTDLGTVTARIYRTDAEHWAIQVADTGRGIPRDTQGDIFEAFWQVDSSITRDVNRGVGLGLSIVKQLVILMQGSIMLQSEPGHGSIFTITLPLDEKQGELA